MNPVANASPPRARKATAELARPRRRRPTDRRSVEDQLVAADYFRLAAATGVLCGYDGRMGTETVGPDAARLRWWALDGPDTIDNGLCLCSFHHKLLDRGVPGITDDHAVSVSAQLRRPRTGCRGTRAPPRRPTLARPATRPRDTGARPHRLA
jgi:putative restriction endonuclease